MRSRPWGGRGLAVRGGATDSAAAAAAQPVRTCRTISCSALDHPVRHSTLLVTGHPPTPVHSRGRPLRAACLLRLPSRWLEHAHCSGRPAGLGAALPIRRVQPPPIQVAPRRQVCWLVFFSSWETSSRDPPAQPTLLRCSALENSLACSPRPARRTEGVVPRSPPSSASSAPLGPCRA
ncbi:hypothetical protein PVAP13_5KG152007 [Panicum virgatum]|uniref:Uncharacterized protein n=1 Tax=Panicum virgatum TaxID=38727 RepID=A0A8T0SHB4_PANVG|nr:hypothetical protein PVAP13_5KG152007 [Panicum virgatum]